MMNWIKGGLPVALVLSTAHALSPDGKCRVLALRSGGTHGAFEVGVLNAFVDHLTKLDVHYDGPAQFPNDFERNSFSLKILKTDILKLL